MLPWCPTGDHHHRSTPATYSGPLFPRRSRISRHPYRENNLRPRLEKRQIRDRRASPHPPLARAVGPYDIRQEQRTKYRRLENHTSARNESSPLPIEKSELLREPYARGICSRVLSCNNCEEMTVRQAIKVSRQVLD